MYQVIHDDLFDPQTLGWSPLQPFLRVTFSSQKGHKESPGTYIHIYTRTFQGVPSLSPKGCGIDTFCNGTIWHPKALRSRYIGILYINSQTLGSPGGFPPGNLTTQTLLSRVDSCRIIWVFPKIVVPQNGW